MSTDDRPTPDLDIPADAAEALLGFAGARSYYESDTTDAARRIAAPIVAAELRRLARMREYRPVEFWLRTRANSLDPDNAEIIDESDNACATEFCGHPRDFHKRGTGRCTVGQQIDTSAWRCECVGFVEPDPTGGA